MNILASSIFLNNNRLEVPIDMVISDYSKFQIAMMFDENRRMIIMEMVESEDTDESGQTSEESA